MLYQARIASAPAAGLVDVVIPAFDDQQKFTDCPYMPRGTTEPTVGDRCLVAIDDQGDAWVIAIG